MKKLIINVTQRDIDRSLKTAIPGGSRSCPIYLAIHRHKELKEYEVGAFELYSGCIFAGKIPLPEAASRFSAMAWRRQDDELKPFKFRIEV